MTDWIGIIVATLAFILGILNLIFRGPSMGMVERGQFFKSANEAIGLANTRALQAEKRVMELEQKLEKAEQRMILLENSMFYKISFYATLGDEPSVEHVEIIHYKDRRKVDIPVKENRRK